MRKITLWAVVMCLLCFYHSAHAVQQPLPIATDGRIKTVFFNPNEIYKFTGHYGYQSVIEFSNEEEIITISIGDSIAWQLQPSGSRLFIKPVEQDALTNMTVITTLHTYHFELHGEDTGDITDKNLTFVLRFTYGDQGSEYGGLISTGGQLPPPDITDPEVRAQMNFAYSIVGPEIISPIRIFDDGEFTYFEFRDKNAEIPAFFDVNPLMEESILNFRTQGDYIVVERVSPRFTLRSGAYVVCVYNENMEMPQIPMPEERSWWEKIF
jgi:type IV secretion system protein VirB9